MSTRSKKATPREEARATTSDPSPDINLDRLAVVLKEQFNTSRSAEMEIARSIEFHHREYTRRDLIGQRNVSAQYAMALATFVNARATRELITKLDSLSLGTK